MERRQFMKGMLASATLGGMALPRAMSASPAEAEPHYGYLGRMKGYREWQVIDPGLKITKLETFTRGPLALVRVTVSDGSTGWGQIAPYDSNLTALVLHQKVARHILGRDASEIDDINDRVIDANMKFPWSFACRALGGIDTALWDLYGKKQGQPVCELIGGSLNPIPAYGSSMSRSITPDDEAERLVRLRAEEGFSAFKIRVGQSTGHDRDASPGRTGAIIPAVRKALGSEVDLLADANSCYTPPRAIEVGRILEDHGYYHFEEPCPYWELEWTAAVTAALKMKVAGGEQDNDLAQWRRMIAMNAVDILQPDICYIGGITRTLRVAEMARGTGHIVVPHAANLSLVTVFTMHVMAAIPNAGPYLEYSIEYDSDLTRQVREMFDPALQVRDGVARMSPEPGWGVTVRQSWLDHSEYQVSEYEKS